MSSPGPAANRVALVTGGSRGIGAATVRQLAARGVSVGCGYARSREAAQRLAKQCADRVVPVPYLLGDAASAQEAVSATVREWDRLDAVIANAGTWAGGRLTAMAEQQWTAVVSETLDGIAQLCRAALPHLPRDGSGSITIVSSVIGLVGGPGDTAYASAKAGLFGFGRSLAKEVARDGIRVNLLAPGFVDTDMTAQVPASSRQEIARSILLGRPAQIDEVAAAAVYLSEDATYCTGSILTVDGGWTI